MRPTTEEEAIEVLKFFNSKVRRIMRYSFFRHKMPSKPTKGRKNESGAEAKESRKALRKILPSDEQIDAVTLHLRFFISKQETISFYALPAAYALLPLSADEKKECATTFQQWKDWLNQPSKRIENRTNDQFLHVMLYGERVHRNRLETIKDHDHLVKIWGAKFVSRGLLCEKITGLMICLLKLEMVHRKILESLQR